MIDLAEFVKNYVPKHDGSSTLSIDGTGVKASVQESIAKRLKEFIIREYPQVRSIVDVGAGQGYLQAAFEPEGFEFLSIEGSKKVGFEANKDYRLQEDFSVDLPDSLTKRFDLLVSFECIEHVHQTEQQNFWNNVKKVSSRALVGIHAANEEHAEHCFIRGPEYWNQFFSEQGFQYELLSSYGGWEPVPEWECSLFYKLQY